MLKIFAFISLLSWTGISYAQVICEPAALPKNPSQLSCGIDRTAAYTSPTQKVSSVTILVIDSAHGGEQQVQIHKVNQPLSKLSAKNIASNQAVKAELTKLKKAWSTKGDLKVEILSYEFAPKANFYNDVGLKKQLSTAKLVRGQPRSMASESQVKAGGVRQK